MNQEQNSKRKKIGLIIALILVVTSIVIILLEVFNSKKNSNNLDQNDNVIESNNNEENENDEVNIGDYVNYTYDDANDYQLSSSISGYTKDQIITQTKSLSWRVLDINADGSINIISTEDTDDEVYLNGIIGYNNGIFLLNDICDKQYSNKKLGAKSRNLNLEDIEKYLDESSYESYENISNIKYGSTSVITGYYPTIYKMQNGSGIDSSVIKTDGISESENYYTSDNLVNNNKDAHGKTLDNKYTATQTFYYLNSDKVSEYFDNKILYDTLFVDGEYWLSTRYVNISADQAVFGIRSINTKSITGNDIVGSSGMNYGDKKKLRPVVTINSNIKLVKDSNSIWQIKEK